MAPERIHETWVHSERLIPTRFVRPLQRFMANEAAGGVILLIAAVAAVIWANSSFVDAYHHLWETEFLVELGGFHLEETLEELVNDGLMVIFFFVVGLEIKRELVLGELRDPKAAALPVAGALGGMILPALIYVVIAGGGGRPEVLRGWAVPVATDIAFSVAVLSMLRGRVPLAARIFLLALAIADDLGGILVIAIFYTDELAVGYLIAVAVTIVLIASAARVGIRSFVVYVPLAFALWYFFLESGVHATIAGVVLAFLTPAYPMYAAGQFKRRAERVVATYPTEVDTQEEREHVDHQVLELSHVSRESVAPLTRLEHMLQPWVAFAIVPIFALANAGVEFEGSVLDALLTPLALGVALGLVIGKTVGISLFSWVAIKLRIASMPSGTGWRQLIGVSAIAGIGFTVALFITALAFTDPILANEAKTGVFFGSIVAGLLGSAILMSGGHSPLVGVTGRKAPTIKDQG